MAFAINQFKEMTPTTSGVMARFPRLFPIRNPCELRGLCRRSYFGPRTCGRNITIVIEVGRALNPGFPFSPRNEMSTFVFSPKHKGAE